MKYFLSLLLVGVVSPCLANDYTLVGDQVVTQLGTPAVQTITIKEPVISWDPKVEYVEREVQVSVPTVQVPCSVGTVVTQLSQVQPSVVLSADAPVYQTTQLPVTVQTVTQAPPPPETHRLEYTPARVSIDGVARDIEVPLRARLGLKALFRRTPR